MKTKLYLVVMCIALSIINSNAQVRLLIPKAEKGNLDAQMFLAESYFYGTNGLDKNLIEARKWYEKAAAQGCAEAEFALYEFNRRINNGNWANADDLMEAMPHLKRSTELGYPPAINELGIMILATGDDNKGAVACFIEAANKGYAGAYIELGNCYLRGIGVEKNYEEAMNYFEKAVAAGKIGGLLGMAYSYKKMKNYKKSKEYYQKAIDADLIDGYNGLAYLYAMGNGVKQDFNEAHRLIDIAIKKDETEPNYYDSKGEFYLMEGRMDEAKKMWNKVIAINPRAKETQTVLALAMDTSVDYNIPINNTISDKSFAIIIANEEYKRASAVPFAKNDGKVFSEYCKKTLGIPEKNIYYVEDATLGDIKYHLNLIKKVLNAYNGEARVIFYYAGHGVPDENDKSAYLLPIDGYTNDATSGIQLKDLYDILGSIDVQNTIVFMDACFSGAKRDGEMFSSVRGVAIKPKTDVPKGKLIVLSAAEGNETASSYQEMGHGMFTYYLLKKLQESKGEITIGELSDYIKTEVSKQSIVINGKAQTPNVLVSDLMKERWKEIRLK